MRKHSVAVFSVLLLTALSSDSIGAAAEQPNAVISANIKTKIESHFPNIKIDSVAPTPWSGVYEIVTNGQLAYANADASLLFVGKILDVETKEDLTTKRWNEAQRIDYGILPLEHAIKTVRGDGSRTLVVFADPLCPYCQQLERQLTTMENVTVYTFLVPLEGIHPGATATAQRIWCTPDRSATWTQWMVSNTQPPMITDCNQDGLAAVKSLSEKLRINATPTLYFSDGHRASGAISAEQLDREFSASATHLAALAQQKK